MTRTRRWPKFIVFTVKNANQIIVLEKGLIVERGTHVELTANKEAYYHFGEDPAGCWGAKPGYRRRESGKQKKGKDSCV